MPRLEMSVRPDVVVSQQVLQSLQMLAMDVVELRDYIYREYTTNPVLDLQYPSSSTGEPSAGFDAERVAVFPFRDPKMEIRLQLDRAKLSSLQKDIVEWMVAALDPQGFLRETPQEIAAILDVDLAEVELCLQIVQSLQPVGIFSNGVAAYYQKQLEANGQADEILNRLLTTYFDDLLEGRAQSICKELALSPETFREYLNVLASLRRSPLDIEPTQTQSITPELWAAKRDGQWEVRWIDESIGNLTFDLSYDEMFRTTRNEEIKEYLRERRTQARWVIDALELRRFTLCEVTRVLLTKQDDHVTFGGPLVPLRLVDVAEELDLSISTISRAVRGKAVEAERKLVMLSDLVTGAELPTDSGEGVSVDHVQNAIQAIINAENPAKPYSDEAIRKRLEKQGILISRRTVAKYRDRLQIPSSTDRKYLLKDDPASK